MQSDARWKHGETQVPLFHWVSRCMHTTEIEFENNRLLLPVPLPKANLEIRSTKF